MTEFTENANESVETEYSLFFTNFKYKLRMKFNIIKVFNLQSAQKKIDQERTQKILR